MLKQQKQLDKLLHLHVGNSTLMYFKFNLF